MCTVSISLSRTLLPLNYSFRHSPHAHASTVRTSSSQLSIADRAVAAIFARHTYTHTSVCSLLTYTYSAAERHSVETTYTDMRKNISRFIHKTALLAWIRPCALPFGLRRWRRSSDSSDRPPGIVTRSAPGPAHAVSSRNRPGRKAGPGGSGGRVRCRAHVLS